MSDKAQCSVAVYRRDTYRVKRGSKSGFAMHYNRCRCSRAATHGFLCKQHFEMAKTRSLEGYERGGPPMSDHAATARRIVETGDG